MAKVTENSKESRKETTIEYMQIKKDLNDITYNIELALHELRRISALL